MAVPSQRIILCVVVPLLLLLLHCTTTIADETAHVALPPVATRPEMFKAVGSSLHSVLRKLEERDINNQDDIYNNDQNDENTGAEYYANYDNNDDRATTTTNNNNSSSPRKRKSGTSIFAIIFLTLMGFAMVILCIFAPICCYPLSLWDIVSVYCHWEKCHTVPEGSDYVNVFDGVVVI